jgi:hypothetical protein
MNIYNLNLEINNEPVDISISDVLLGEFALRAQKLKCDFEKYLIATIAEDSFSNQDLIKERPDFFVKYTVWLYEDPEPPIVLDVELSLLGCVANMALKRDDSINNFIVKTTINAAEEILGLPITDYLHENT